MNEKNKRIVKNTFFLYLRLFVIIPLSFITSRICFNELGVNDFGIYGLVAGLVVMFSNLRVAFASATQRYYNAIIVKDNNIALNHALFTSIIIHFVLAIILVGIIETFGLWYISNKMVLPMERISAAKIAFQTVVASTVLIILTIPFEAMIIACEKLSYYSYVAIMEVVLKLSLVLLLVFVDSDKLILYSFLMMCSSLITSLMMIIYVLRIKNVRVITVFDKLLFKNMLSFASWNFLGNISYSLVNEGLNIILNIFGGVVANAARSIVCQIRSVINQMITTPSTAIMPQATQNYVIGNYKRFNELICAFSKFSFSVALAIVSSMIFYISDIIKLWLGNVPQYSVSFLAFTLLWILIRSFHSSLDIVYKSSGLVKRYQLIAVSASVINLPLSYFELKYGFPLYFIFLNQFVVELILWGILVYNARHSGLDIIMYRNRVIYSAVILSIFSLVLNWGVYKLMPSSLYLVGIFVSFIISIFVIYILGLNEQEKILVNSYIKKHIRK